MFMSMTIGNNIGINNSYQNSTKQISQRLFDFASASAGDDVDKMKEMQKAMEKGLSWQPVRGSGSYQAFVKIRLMRQISYLTIIMLRKRSSRNRR